MCAPVDFLLIPDVKYQIALSLLGYRTMDIWCHPDRACGFISCNISKSNYSYINLACVEISSGYVTGPTHPILSI